MTTEQRLFARHLRKHSTRAEDVLWQALRGRRLDGLKFRRQVPLLDYVVDFLCSDRKLVIEVDGVQHERDAAYDARRTGELESQGLWVIRFTNEQVLGDLDDVLHRIRAAASPLSRTGEGQG